MGSWASTEKFSNKQNKRERGLEEPNSWASSLWALLSAKAGEPPSSIQVQAQSNSKCSLVETSGSSVSPTSSSGSSNYQRPAVQIHLKREEHLFEKDLISIPRGLRTSPPEPAIVSPSGSFSAFTSVPTILFNSNNFCNCNTSYRKDK